MKIEMKDGRVLMGTELQIIEQMRSLAFGMEGASTREYVDFVVEQTERFEEIKLNVAGANDDELAHSLIAEMERVELVRRVVDESAVAS